MWISSRWHIIIHPMGPYRLTSTADCYTVHDLNLPLACELNQRRLFTAACLAAMENDGFLRGYPCGFHPAATALAISVWWPSIIYGFRIDSPVV